MTHGSLFSGIGGFDLAAQRMGWDNMFHCEWNEFGQQVLKYYWPEAELFKDIKKSDFKKYHGQIDVLSGGFPCQPYSAAGKRLGTEDDRHLWPEMLRAVREIQPRWVVGENVRGLTNWNGGLVFDEVQANLEAAGYQVLPFLLPACAVNAPHRRDRIWFIAHATGYGQQLRQPGEDRPAPSALDTDGEQRERVWDNTGRVGESGFATHTQAIGVQGDGTAGEQEPQLPAGERLPGRNDAGNYWDVWPTEPALCSRNDGLPARLAGITFSKHRNESIKAYGNAVVPQVVYQIFKAIEQFELNNSKTT